jgi:hypothetical protein
MRDEFGLGHVLDKFDNLQRAVEQVGDGRLLLRDWFAGQALPVVLARIYDEDDDLIARAAYRIADAMLAARAKEPK